MTAFRKTNKEDLSFNDLVRGYGSPMIDIDHVFPEYIDGRKRIFCAIERKHPNTRAISYDASDCDCTYALTSQRDHFTYDLKIPVPYFIMINWTKDNSDPNLDHDKGPPMVYMVPGNYVAWKAQKLHHDSDPWYTPRAHARFINELRTEPGYVKAHLLKLSDERHEYEVKTRIDWASLGADFTQQREELLPSSRLAAL